MTVGSVCSGIEAASVAWSPLGFRFLWFSEIAPFPATVLREKYPGIPNLGDMNAMPTLIAAGQAEAPDLICGGTPCQAFSYAGFKAGLLDGRGNLTLRFADIVEASDRARLAGGKRRSLVFWENVEGVLTDKTNAFGCLVSFLAGLSEPVSMPRWPAAGLVQGPKRTVAWRLLDAKYFGVPQQRKRLYVLAGDTDFHPENILFELHTPGPLPAFPQIPLTFQKGGHFYEAFRAYTDCLYAAYGTKWNGNAAANNGSLFLVQDGRIRRLTPEECESLMGFPPGYTNIPGAVRTARYTAIGNSWAVPVVRWIGERIKAGLGGKPSILPDNEITKRYEKRLSTEGRFFCPDSTLVPLSDGLELNCSTVPERAVFGRMEDIVRPDAPEALYLSPAGCAGIVRRSRERGTSLNPRLEEVLLQTAEQWTPEAIEARSRIQKRGRYSAPELPAETVNPREGEPDAGL